MCSALSIAALLGCAACGGADVHPTAVPAPTRAAGETPAPIAVTPGRVAGPIAGRWRVSCAENEGEIIEIAVDKDSAVGRVAEPGKAKVYGFTTGEELFRLTLERSGDWVGTVRWRGRSGAQHWDGIRLFASDTTLAAILTNESCYRSMAREP